MGWTVISPALVVESELTQRMGYSARRYDSCEGSRTYGGPQPPTERRGPPQRATIHCPRRNGRTPTGKQDPSSQNTVSSAVLFLSRKPQLGRSMQKIQYVYMPKPWLAALLVALLCRKESHIGYVPVAHLRSYSRRLCTNPKSLPDQMRIARVTPAVSSISHPQTHGILFSPRCR